MTRTIAQYKSDRTLEQRLDDFSSLLEELTDIDEKKKKLWYEIYQNAITDREMAHGMFLKLSAIAADQSSEHAVHAKSMVSYIERMSKANDQLIKLSEVISSSQASVGEMSSDDVYARLQQ